MSPLDRFEAAFSFVLENEGGYVNHPLDKGGPTNHGITTRTLSQFLGREATETDVKDLTLETAKKIYFDNYWTPLNLDKVEEGFLCTMLFDQAVNRGVTGVSNQVKRLLEGVDFKAPHAFAIAFLKDTQLIYTQIVKRNPAQSVFVTGWIARTHRLLDLILDDLVQKNPTLARSE